MSRPEPAIPSRDGSYRIVLALTDATPSAEAAVDVAAELAGRAGATLHVAAAVQPDEAKVDLGGLTEMTQPGTREFATHLQGHVEALSAGAGERWGCAVEATVLTADDPADGLTEYQRRVGVDLTVVGVPLPRDGAGDRVDFTRQLAYDVEGRLPSPLLLLPGTDAESDGERPRPLSVGRPVVAILGPYDTTAEAGLPAQAAAFATAVGSDLILIDSVPSGRLLEQDRVDPALVHPEESPAETRERLRATAGALQHPGLKVEHEMVEGPDAHETLVRFLRERRAGTLALGPEGGAMIERLLLEQGLRGQEGSVAIEERFAVLVCPAEPNA